MWRLSRRRWRRLQKTLEVMRPRNIELVIGQRVIVAVDILRVAIIAPVGSVEDVFEVVVDFLCKVEFIFVDQRLVE